MTHLLGSHHAAGRGRFLLVLVAVPLLADLLLTPGLLAGNCGGAHAVLPPKAQESLNTLEKGLANTLGKLEKYRQKLAGQEANLAGALAALAAAEEMPEDTGKQREARQDAIAAARRKIQKATRGIDRWTGKTVKKEVKRDALFTAIRSYDP
ncbi:MAG: hypothetical protein ABIG68_14195, partial [Acidobacteriota bacterium]